MGLDSKTVRLPELKHVTSDEYSDLFKAVQTMDNPYNKFEMSTLSIDFEVGDTIELTKSLAVRQVSRQGLSIVMYTGKSYRDSGRTIGYEQ